MFVDPGSLVRFRVKNGTTTKFSAPQLHSLGATDPKLHQVHIITLNYAKSHLFLQTGGFFICLTGLPQFRVRLTLLTNKDLHCIMGADTKTKARYENSGLLN